MATFTKNQLVRGIVTGHFVVVKTEASKIDGQTIVTVKERHPVTGEVNSRGKMRFPASMLVAD